jgi:outer membrane lipoprotein SlyB
MGFHEIVHQTIGQVSNPGSIVRSIDIPKATIVMGASAIGAFVGTKIGGPLGTAVGTLVGSHVGTLAVGNVEYLKVSVNGFGAVEVVYRYA